MTAEISIYRVTGVVRPTWLALAFLFIAALANAQNGDVKSIEIPAGPLEGSLLEVGRLFSVDVLVAGDLAGEYRAPAVSGNLTAEAALTELVEDSSLDVQPDGEGFLIVARTTEPATDPVDNPSDESSSDNDTRPSPLEEIVVKGENILRPLLDTNTSINIQTEEDIVRSNDKRISEVFSRAANVNVNGSGLQAFSFSVRGVNSSGVGGAGTGQVASLMVDGAAFTTQQFARGFNSLFDVQQVEMLRGPQNTAQARNSLAGGVVVSTNDPEFEQRTTGVASFGNFGSYELGLANTGAITEQLAYRVTVQRLSTDGFIDNPVLGIDDYNFSETDTFRGKLLYKSKALPLQILFSRTHVAADARNDTSAWFPDERSFTNSNPYGDGGMDTEQDVTTLRVSYGLSDAWGLEWQTAYNEFLSADLNSNYATTLPDRDRAWFATADQEEINHTLRVTYEGERIRGSVGLFYSDETNRALRDGVADPNFQGSGFSLDLVTDSPIDTQTEALFGEFDILINETLTLTLGGRYERVDFNSKASTTASFVLPPPGPFVVVAPLIDGFETDASTDFSEFLPKVGVTYMIDEYQRVGFTFTEGYRQGGLTFSPATFAPIRFDPEFVRNYELSYKSAFPSGVTLNANLFYLDWADQQVNDQEPGSLLPVVLNAGESTVYGTEIELAWQNRTWDSYVTLGYVNTEFDNFTTNNVNFAGNTFPNAPELTAAVGAFYSFDNLTLGAEANYRSGFFTRANNEFKTESLTIVDLSADYHVGEVTIRGFVNNLFDDFELIGETFVIESITQGGFSAPRTYGVQLLYGF
ncbi:MAG: TonB-dependent receptor [Pseudomonadota bacterium]